MRFHGTWRRKGVRPGKNASNASLTAVDAKLLLVPTVGQLYVIGAESNPLRHGGELTVWPKTDPGDRELLGLRDRQTFPGLPQCAPRVG